MKVYITFTQTSGTGAVLVNILNANKDRVWYTDGDVCYTDVEDFDALDISSKFITDVAETAEIDLAFFDIESNIEIYTLTLQHTSTVKNTSLSCTTTSINLGATTIGSELTSSAIAVTGVSLKGYAITVSGFKDDSFLFSGDNINWYKNSIPLNQIIWGGSTTFNIYIKRLYTYESKFYGKNKTPIVFTNDVGTFTIDVSSEFTSTEQLESGILKRDSGSLASTTLDVKAKSVICTAQVGVPTSPYAGQIIFNGTTNRHQAYDGTVWHNLY